MAMPAGAEVVRDLGTGPTVVLVHGVGVGPRSFDAMVERLSGRHRVVVLRRPSLSGRSVEAAAADLAHAVRALGDDDVTVVGVSGGATLALAAAVAEPARFGAVVVHEPLVGALAPALDRRVRAGAARLAAGEVGSDEWLRGLLGEGSWRAAIAGGDRTDVSSDEVAAFVAWEPGAEQLAALRRVALTTTVGESSDADRREAAAVLARLGGARVVVVPGAGHLPQLEAPGAFADVVSAARVGP